MGIKMGRNFDDYPDFQQKARGMYKKHCNKKYKIYLSL